MSTPVFVKDTDWLDWDSEPTKPSFLVPPGAVDAHCHVFGPGGIFPFAPERKYTPCDASREQLFALRDFLGFDKNVVVQATCHGSDNAALLDVLEHSDGRARGVVTVRPEVDVSELARMHELGVRGVRFNFVKRLVDPKPDEYYRTIIEKIRPLGWHVVLYFEPDDLADRWDFFTFLDVPIVVDHMGRPDVSRPVANPQFELFQSFMRENPQVITKVSCPDRLSITGSPEYTDVVPFARAIVEEFPDRVLWGTDWPHPNMKKEMPDDGILVDYVPSIATTPALQQKLLVTNPTTLYWS
ncbi:2-pyrone-4,6-dicarboxylate hydrolase [Microbacterium aurum]|uniref:2-pyrone-4,6-dicarboxylate hydrolase n=1 Tax=Microbacterium aurum TaxID=36805 RepID=A0A1P8U776_9MICO|nr:amidohydrolase family protein [Microbacterium aurum]APZ33923.1 2-pyrone-4,6-dicarboxylate hydrolase [Microbacterium aurum]MBM7827684.1 2-pyrone-4,6-dicarboxylate lactonase [Microbacterium aurum]